MAEVEVIPASLDAVEPEVVASGDVLPEMQQAFRGTQVFPAEIVEGMLAQLIFSVKYSLDVVYLNKVKSLTRMQNIEACYKITSEEVEDALGRLRPYNRASLNPKHRLCRDILEAMSERLKVHDVRKAKRTTNKKVKGFGRDVVEFLSAMHVTLAEDTPKKKRVVAAEAFCGSE